MPLSFSHLTILAKVEKKERAVLIEEALSRSWSVRDLKAALPSARTTTNPSVASPQFLKTCARLSNAAVERAKEEIASLERLKKDGTIDLAQIAVRLGEVAENCRRASILYAELEVSLAELLVNDSNQQAAE